MLKVHKLTSLLETVIHAIEVNAREPAWWDCPEPFILSSNDIFALEYVFDERLQRLALEDI